MRVSSRLRHLPIGFNMTPMIDVVFLLIIFFLLSNHLAQRERRIPVDLPAAASGQTETSDDLPRLTVTLEANGSLWLAAQPVAAAELGQRLKLEQQRHDGRLELRVRCDRHVPYREVEPVLSQAVQAGIVQVSFAVLAPSAPAAADEGINARTP